MDEIEIESIPEEKVGDFFFKLFKKMGDDGRVTIKRSGNPIAILLPFAQKEEKRRELEEFIEFCRGVSDKAAQKGLTEQKLDKLLNEE